MKTIMVGNQKGGVGKTTTAITIAADFARRHYEVLIIDLDSQGHVAPSLGMEKDAGAFHLIAHGKAGWCKSTGRQGLHVIRSDKNTAVAAQGIKDPLCLHHTLSRLDEIFDFVILDTSPGFNKLTVATILATDHVLIPVQLDSMGIDGLVELTKSILQAQADGAEVALSWVVPTFYEKVTTETSRILGQLVHNYGALVTGPIPHDVRVREAPRLGRTLWEHAPSCRAALAYLKLCGRILDDLGYAHD